MDGLELIKIHNWTFDPVKKTLKPDITENNESQANVSEEVSLEAKQADLLLCLIQQTGQIVSRDMLLEQVWNNRYVDDTTINATVSRLRKLLGGAKYQYIKTHPKLGYSFCAEVDYIERPKTHYSTKEKILSLKAIKIYATIITVALFAIVTYLFSISQESAKTLLPKDVKIEPLTYMEGREYASALSGDGELLAFVHQIEMDDYANLVVQNLATSKYASVEPGHNTSSPFWVSDSKGNTRLYYISGEENKCLIKRVYIDDNLNMRDRETIAHCAKDFTNSPIAVTKDQNYLYFVYYNEFPAPSVLKRKNLLSGEIKQITAPPTNYFGDYFFSLSPNEKYLVFERAHDNFLVNLMHLNLVTGELKTLLNDTGFVEGLVWLPSSDKLQYITQNFALKEFDIDDSSQTTIYQSNVHIEDMFLSENGELLISVGNRYHANVAALDLLTLEKSVLVDSSFRDFDGTQPINADSTYFVSTRSGSYQIWRKDKDNRLTQLSKFTENSRIEELSISPSGKHIIFKRGLDLSLLSISSGEVTAIKQSNTTFSDTVWHCQDDGLFFVTAKKGAEWNLLSYNIVNKKFNKVARDVMSVAKDCYSNETFVALQDIPGVYLLKPDNSISTLPSGLYDKFVLANTEWAVGSEGFYHIDIDGHITHQSRDSKDSSLLLKIRDARFRVSNNLLIYNDVSHNNTYIGKITISN